MSGYPTVLLCFTSWLMWRPTLFFFSPFKGTFCFLQFPSNLWGYFGIIWSIYLPSFSSYLVYANLRRKEYPFRNNFSLNSFNIHWWSLLLWVISLVTAKWWIFNSFIPSTFIRWYYSVRIFSINWESTIVPSCSQS